MLPYNADPILFCNFIFLYPAIDRSEHETPLQLTLSLFAYILIVVACNSQVYLNYSNLHLNIYLKKIINILKKNKQ